MYMYMYVRVCIYIYIYIYIICSRTASFRIIIIRNNTNKTDNTNNASTTNNTHAAIHDSIQTTHCRSKVYHFRASRLQRLQLPLALPRWFPSFAAIFATFAAATAILI